jgi:glycine/D-amino acid oxidase-like deaminating enzyme
MPMRARRLPGDDDDCGWWQLLPPPAPPRRLEREVEADCVVVGAGFTGLATAWRLAESRPGWRIALLEAQRAGFAASGRNSGFAGSLSHRNPDLDPDGALRVVRLSRAGIAWLHERVESHAIACDWSECGRIHAARERHARRNLDHLRRTLDAAGEPFAELDGAALAEAIGSEHYRAGVHVERTVLLQPAALARGLATHLPANVTLYEESPVRALEPDGGWQVRAGSGSVRAARVFLALNGFAPALGVLRRRIFPLFTFASLTPVLDERVRARLGVREQWGLVSEDRMGTTLRRTCDQRLLVRGRVRYAPSLRSAQRHLLRMRRHHHRSMAARWPSLGDAGFEFTWGGVMGTTMNQGQFFGRLGPELFASAGYNGTGVALGSGCGLALAAYALGEDSPLVPDALALPAPAWIPPDPLLGVGVRAATAFLGLRAGAER